jgi:hypothetical protein
MKKNSAYVSIKFCILKIACIFLRTIKQKKLLLKWMYFFCLISIIFKHHKINMHYFMESYAEKCRIFIYVHILYNAL